jgi:hypothetical protein
MSSLPSIIADGYELLAPQVETGFSDPTAALLGIFGLLDRCWKLDARFRAFYAALEQKSLGPIYWPELPKQDELDTEDPDLGRVFPVAFHFPNLEMAHLCIMYWASSAILWSGMAFSYKILEQFKLDAQLAQFPRLEHRRDVASLARNICQSVEYLMLTEYKVHGKTAAVFPLKVAIETLNDASGCERELKWALNAMGRISGIGGVKLMNHIGVALTDHAFLPG